MIQERENVHPAVLLQGLGVSETPTGIGVALVAAFQYFFLIKLWEGYVLRRLGDVVHPFIGMTGMMTSVAGAGAILCIFRLRQKRRSKANHRIEKPATNASFTAIRRSLERVVGRSTLKRSPELRYSPKDALALTSRETASGDGQSIVVGLHQRERQGADPDAFEAQLAHEVSHLELAATAIESGVRRAVALHFCVLGWLVAVFTLTLGFVNPRGIGSGFEPVFDARLYFRLIPHALVLAFSTAIVFVYSYFFVVRREHIHDFRGCQLAGNDLLATRIFEAATTRDRFGQGIVDFFRIHPTASARRRVLLTRDLILLSPLLYPLIVAGIMPTMLLLLAGWRDVFHIDPISWHVGLTIADGVMLFLLLRADIARLGLSVLVRRRYLLLVPLYAITAGVATQIPRLLLEASTGIQKGRSMDAIARRTIADFMSGGLHVTVMIALTLVLLAYLTGVRIAVVGETRGTRRGHDLMLAVIAVCAFTAISLQTAAFIFTVMVVAGGISMLYLLLILVTRRCVACGRHRLSALRLAPRCRCGHDLLPNIHVWTRQGYAHHLPARQFPVRE
ncbi:hypothetical protein BSFA1_63790 (plasmid) [Burkholderia sp. SFA1]|uniref:hypothetical protein n=1 Tax=unclassified Caballeronia TaxID=2646786 RepID=UPI001F190286|nr:MULTISPECIES: hypothetical protein [unclassified Caballeronia]MCE4545897.1 hypothetical protein [Caballeronia sp. PC1]MCE4571981.1 hypothetical protein [Caballeronia sp. CLC5]BBQ01251.1 hypothetical protein BSFA1_63790 [Burkholderia sp. SFA1]